MANCVYFSNCMDAVGTMPSRFYDKIDHPTSVEVV